VHVVLSLIGIVAGAVVMYALVTAKRVVASRREAAA
jgi:hypothetical protein